MLNQTPARMVFGNGKISYSKQTNALNIFSIQDAILLDVRTIQEFSRTKIPSAQHIALEDLANQLNLIQTWTLPIIVYCTDGSKSRVATRLLKRAKVNAIDGGAREELIKLLQKKEAIKH